MAFQPVPTYADVAEVDPKTGKSAFNPVWLSWFVELSNGNIATVVQHNSLQGLQGGTSSQYYHLTQAQYNSITYRSTAAPAAIVVGGSPFTYHNTNTYDLDVIVQGGTVSLVEFSRDNTTYYNVGFTSGIVRLSPSDYLRVTYTVTPTMTGVPR